MLREEELAMAGGRRAEELRGRRVAKLGIYKQEEGDREHDGEDADNHCHPGPEGDGDVRRRPRVGIRRLCGDEGGRDRDQEEQEIQGKKERHSMRTRRVAEHF